MEVQRPLTVGLPLRSLLSLLLWSLSFTQHHWTANALNQRLYGVNYSLRVGPDWTFGSDRCRDATSARRTLSQLRRDVTNNIRVFSVRDCDTAAMLLPLTRELAMGLWLGLWVGPDGIGFEEERARLNELLNDSAYNFDHVLGVHVSSEAIYRKEISVSEAIDMREAIKEDFNNAGYPNIPIVVADIIDTNLKSTRLITQDSTVSIFNQFPFWERKTDIDGAEKYMSDRVKLVEAHIDSRQLIVTETGWADAGTNEDSNTASPANMVQWLNDFWCLANDREWQYFWFDAYDSDWRRINDQLPDDVEGHFGLYDANEVLKPHIQSLTIDCSDTFTGPSPTVPVTPNAGAPATPTVVNNADVSPPITPNQGIPTAPTAVNEDASAPITPNQGFPTPTEPPIGATQVSPTTSVPTTAPSTTPVQAPPISVAPTAVPIVAPVHASPISVAPTVAPTTAPTGAPVEAPPSGAPTVTPTVAPTAQTPTTVTPVNPIPTTRAPVMIPYIPLTLPPFTPDASRSECSVHAGCASLGLGGDCCPTSDDWTLACCLSSGGGGGSTEDTIENTSDGTDGTSNPTAVVDVEACEINVQCDALGLVGACCPTFDMKYLDCCTAVPDRCQENGACIPYSAVQYKRELDEAASQAAASSIDHPRVASWMGFSGLLLLPVLLDMRGLQ